MYAPVIRVHLGAHRPETGHPVPSQRRDQTVDDAFLKRAFAHPRTVELLIRRHLPEWADKVDFATLEPLPTTWSTRCGGCYVRGGSKTRNWRGQ